MLATVIAGIYVLAFNFYYTKRYLPELKIKKQYFSFNAIKELVAAGIWNSITKLSQILLDGLDLLLSNIFVSGLMTGNVSIPESWMLLVLNGIIDVGIGSIITLLIMFNKEQRTRFLKKVLKRK